VLCQRPRSESPRTRPRDVTEARKTRDPQTRPMGITEGRFLEAEATGVRPRLRPESPRTRPRSIGFGLKTEARQRGLT